jgi:hypothetical protein
MGARQRAPIEIEFMRAGGTLRWPSSKTAGELMFRKKLGLLMIARADGEPLHAIFEEAACWAIASGVKVTVEKVELSRMEGSVCDLQVQEF